MGDMVHDYRILETARADAALLIESNAFWHSEDYRKLREKLEETGILDGEKLD